MWRTKITEVGGYVRLYPTSVTRDTLAEKR